MAHSSELHWGAASGLVGEAAARILVGLDEAEAIYQDLFEVYQFVGASDQEFADQLFASQWQDRWADGVQAVITVDVVSGAIENPQITNGGTGYEDGFNYPLTVYGLGGGMPASLAYDVVDGIITRVRIISAFADHDDGTDISILEMPAPLMGVLETEADAEEVAKVTDLRAAITALHDLYLAMNDGVVTQENRVDALRRMS